MLQLSSKHPEPSVSDVRVLCEFPSDGELPLALDFDGRSGPLASHLPRGLHFSNLYSLASSPTSNSSVVEFLWCSVMMFHMVLRHSCWVFTLLPPVDMNKCGSCSPEPAGQGPSMLVQAYGSTHWGSAGLSLVGGGQGSGARGSCSRPTSPCREG